MAIVHKISHKARFFPTGNIFTASFNSPEPGKYSFNASGNYNQKCFEMQKNSAYLIERINIGGNVSEEIYNNSMEITPVLTLKTSKSGVHILEKPFPIVNYIDNQDISTFLYSDLEGDTVTLTMNGTLKQIPDTIGEVRIILTVSFSIFAMDSTTYFRYFRDAMEKDAGKELRT